MGQVTSGISNVASKIWDAGKSVVGKVTEGAKWLADKARGVISGVKSGIDTIRTLPVIGTAAGELLDNTAIGQGFQRGLGMAENVVGTANQILNPGGN